MSLKDCNWRTSSKTPHSYNFITTACGNESIFIVNSHVRNLSRVPSKCSQKASIICCPDFHQTVIGTLQQYKRTKDLQWNRNSSPHKGVKKKKKKQKQSEDFIKVVSKYLLFSLFSSYNMDLIANIKDVQIIALIVYNDNGICEELLKATTNSDNSKHF